MSGRRARTGAVLLLALLSSSCLSGRWQRTVFNQPIAAEVVEELPVGASLKDCLDVLGAPTIVREHRVHGLLLAWAWGKDRTVGASLSVPVYRSLGVSMGYNDRRVRPRGVVLWFDEEWVLERRDVGWLDAFVADERKPASLEDIEG
jgi:hypothetical protein